MLLHFFQTVVKIAYGSFDRIAILLKRKVSPDFLANHGENRVQGGQKLDYTQIRFFCVPVGLRMDASVIPERCGHSNIVGLSYSASDPGLLHNSKTPRKGTCPPAEQRRSSSCRESEPRERTSETRLGSSILPIVVSRHGSFSLPFI